MKEKIKSICGSIEQEENVKILFAIENGSRAWRMESRDSDYDVRFVFVRPLEKYIQIKKPKEVIERNFDEKGNVCSGAEVIIDMVGFDVIKYADMLSASNPTTIEWMMSDILYYGEQNKTFKKYILEHFSIITLYYHYKSMCKNNYVKYLRSKSLVTYKKYLYAYRGLVNALWVIHKKTIPPIIFTDAISGISTIIPDHISKKLYEIISLKIKREEKEVIDNIIEMDEYIEDFMTMTYPLPEKKAKIELEALNAELRNVIIN